MKRFFILAFLFSVLSLVPHVWANNVGVLYTLSVSAFPNSGYTFYENGVQIVKYSHNTIGTRVNVFYSSTTGSSVSTSYFQPALANHVPVGVRRFSDPAMWTSFLTVCPDSPGGLMPVYFPPPPGGYVSGQTYSYTVPEPSTALFFSMCSGLLFLPGRKRYLQTRLPRRLVPGLRSL